MSFQFTENAVATRATRCERLACQKIIQPGQARLSAEDAHGHVKFVCAPCRIHYDEKIAKAKAGRVDHTGIRDSAINTSRSSKAAEVPLLDFQTMRQNVNESQRQGGHAPGGRVTALPIVANVSQQRYHSENSSAGYSQNHSQHALQQSIWSQRAYKGFNANQVGTLTINLLVYAPSFTKGQPTIVDGIKEGVRISSDITARALSKLIRETLLPPLVEFCGPVFFDIDEMVLRNTSNGGWTRVDDTSDEPYFGTDFLKPNPRKKDGGLVFSIPANMKLPVFGLVFPPGVWKEIEAMQEEKIYGHHLHSPGIGSTVSLPVKRKLASGNRSKNPRKRTVRKEESPHYGFDDDRVVERLETPPWAKEDENGEEAGQEDSNDKPEQEDYVDVQEEAAEEDDDDQDEQDKQDEHDEEEQDDEQEDEQDDVQVNGVDQNNVMEIDFESVKRQFMDAVATAQPTEPRATKTFVPLDRDTIQKGFSEGGINLKTSSRFLSEQISFIELPEPTFAELISNPTKLGELMLGPEADVYNAHIRYDPTPAGHLGVGSFKTTSKARLTFNCLILPTTGLGKLVNKATAPQTESDKKAGLSIALKRPYRTKRGGAKGRLAFPEEENAVFEECKLLIWADSLLKAAYDYVSDFMAKKPNPPPFSIPAFRFVAAGMAIALKPVDNTAATPTSSRAAYILEEILPGDIKKDFVKYLHNGSAIPHLRTDDPAYPLAEFLMFIQHVQFKITDGIAYVSDFQGVGTLLTDPQIMTTPQLGNNLFGDGNLGEAFDQFPTEHQCNKYCKWFELENLSGKLDKSKTSKRKAPKSSKVTKSAPGADHNTA